MCLCACIPYHLLRSKCPICDLIEGALFYSNKSKMVEKFKCWEKKIWTRICVFTCGRSEFKILKICVERNLKISFKWTMENNWMKRPIIKHSFSHLQFKWLLRSFLIEFWIFRYFSLINSVWANFQIKYCILVWTLVDGTYCPICSIFSMNI